MQTAMAARPVVKGVTDAMAGTQTVVAVAAEAVAATVKAEASRVATAPMPDQMAATASTMATHQTAVHLEQNEASETGKHVAGAAEAIARCEIPLSAQMPPSRPRTCHWRQRQRTRQTKKPT